MRGTKWVRFRQVFFSFLAAIAAFALIAGSLRAADPIFDDDEEIAAAKPKTAAADADKPENAVAEITVTPDAPALPEEPTKKDGADSTPSKQGDPATPNSTKTEPPANTPTDKEKATSTSTDTKDAPKDNSKPAEEKPAEPAPPVLEKEGVAAAKTAKAEKPKESLGQRREGEIGRNEELGYLQSKVTAQMLELEERMYRLSDALKSLEPENASRLLIGLKYAREELIQLQMKEIQSALTSQNFRDAVVEQKQVLAKLQRLEQLLLSPDLDFQLQLERLRLMRELIKRLDVAIKEEEREKAATEQILVKEKQLQAVRERKASLNELIASQIQHVQAGQVLAPPADKPPTDKPALDEKSRPAAIESLTAEQQKTREQTAPLEKDAEGIAAAGKKMDEALEQLKKNQPDAALPLQSEALESLKTELKIAEGREQTLVTTLAEEKFAALRKEQANTRKTSELISEMAVQLGDSGAAARGELIRAGGSMSMAETGLGGRNASAADTAQGEALASLKYARELLEGEAEKLLNRLRSEIKKRTLEGLVQMLEGQIAIRETTERLGPKAKDKARAVLTTIVGLATAEGKLIAVGESLTALVEETEFGIALPAVLRSITEAMNAVKERLASADASEEVVAAEKQIEEDLDQLLSAMKQLPSQNDAKGAAAAGGEARDRQLNRLIAELRMVKMLQVRVNRDTKDVDSKRPEELKDLTATIKRRVEAIQDRQDDVHDVTEQIAIERGDELN